MITYRFAWERYAADLSGLGASLYGGRWNSVGTSLLYTAETISLALLELLAGLKTPTTLDEQRLVTIVFPDDLPVAVPVAQLPVGWNASPPIAFTQTAGDVFVAEGAKPILKVPSVLIPEEFNYLLNPAHPAFSTVRITSIEPYKFDTRLLAKLGLL